MFTHFFFHSEFTIGSYGVLKEIRKSGVRFLLKIGRQEMEKKRRQLAHLGLPFSLGQLPYQGATTGRVHPGYLRIVAFLGLLIS